MKIRFFQAKDDNIDVEADHLPRKGDTVVIGDLPYKVLSIEHYYLTSIYPYDVLIKVSSVF